MIIRHYQSFGPLVFDITTKDECVIYLGKPTRINRNRKGAEEYHYEHYIIRFDPETQTMFECTLLPKAVASINNIKVTWDKKFLAQVCKQDDAPQDIFGFIVLRQLGIAITGIHAEDDSQMAISVFRKGRFDHLLSDAVPFEWERL